MTTDGDSEFIVWDAELPGFGVRVKPSGAKSYVFQYRTRDSGRSRRKTIGRHGPLMSLQQARSIARGLLADAARGRDPVGEHRSLREAPTISDLADRYIEEHALPKKRAGSIRNDRRILERHISCDRTPEVDQGRQRSNLRLRFPWPIAKSAPKGPQGLLAVGIGDGRHFRLPYPRHRHTHASHLVSSGMSPAIVGRLLGHTNPSTTQRYAHLADDPLREAIEIMGRKFADRKR